MKKCLYHIAAICCIALVSCAKEAEIVNPDANIIQIRAFCDDELTKTSYQLNENTYEFSWLKGDKIAVQGVNKSNDRIDDAFVFTNGADDGPEASFSAAGNSNYDLGEYAFYPCRYPSDYSSFSFTNPWGSTKYIYYAANQTDLSFCKSGTAVANQEEATAAEYATVRLFGTIVEDAAQPMRHIPLIGKKKGDTNDYYFKAATGVLMVNVKNLPASAAQIRLDAEDYVLNGYFVFDTNGEIKESYKKSGWGQKYMNITTEGDAERSFYFPIPTGTIPAGKLTISVSDGTNIIYSVKNSEDITLECGKITSVPAFTVQPVVVKFSGTHEATVYFSGAVKKVSWTTAQNSVYTDRGNQTNYVTTSGTVITLGNGYTSTGTRYFGYTAYNDADATYSSDESTVVETHSAIPYYNPDLVTSVVGTYSWKQPGDRTSTATGSTSFGNSLAATPGITFAASDNISKGNIMITSFCGKDTRKVYGFYLNATTNLVFSSSQSLFIENGERYHLKEGYNADVRFRVGTDLSVYGTTTDLYCQGGNMYLYHGETYTTQNEDLDISYFLAERP